MSSVNPVFVLPSALTSRTDEIAKGLHGSVTLGAGQFCTNPGLVFVPEAGSEELIQRLGALIAATPPFTMLTPGICSAYCDGADALGQNSRVELVAEPDVKNRAGTCSTSAALFVADAGSFLKDPSLSAEVFGPSTLLIKYSSRDELLKVAHSLEGQLTATIHGSVEELKSHGDLVAVLETKAGRVVFNGFPTGVEVGHAMVHGGPFPATSDGRSTSVGTRAALRFVRPVCYQDFADDALPDELKEANPLKIWRMVDGEMTKTLP
jgi:NADP-dependent aldehyde dehydrogenase